MKATRFVTTFLLQGLMPLAVACGQSSRPGVPDTVEVMSGSLRLTALLWRPSGPSPFPAVLFNHGSGRTDPSQAQLIGPVFAKHGYAFMYLFRRGDGLSAGQGQFMGELSTARSLNGKTMSSSFSVGM